MPQPTAAAAAGAGADSAAAVLTMEGLSLQQQEQQQQQGLRLRSFSSSCPKAVDMLTALQPHSLTRVDLDFLKAATDSAALAITLQRLSSLQQLRISNMHQASLWSALTVLVQLSQLTSLELRGV
jgi:hypothetical protein